MNGRRIIEVTCKEFKHDSKDNFWEGCPFFKGLVDEGGRKRKCGYNPKVIKIVEADPNKFSWLPGFNCPLKEETKLPDCYCD